MSRPWVEGKETAHSAKNPEACEEAVVEAVQAIRAKKVQEVFAAHQEVDPGEGQPAGPADISLTGSISSKAANRELARQLRLQHLRIAEHEEVSEVVRIKAALHEAERVL